jgi:hypothetical protein
MIQKGLFRLAILPGTLAGFYCNETTNGQYFSESAMAVENSLKLSYPHPIPLVPVYEHLYQRYTTSWHEPNRLEQGCFLTIEIDGNQPDTNLRPNPNQFNLTWLNGTGPFFKGIAQRHGDWLYGNYWEVAKA